jgi:hypothetical protein
MLRWSRSSRCSPNYRTFAAGCFRLGEHNREPRVPRSCRPAPDYAPWLSPKLARLAASNRCTGVLPHRFVPRRPATSLTCQHCPNLCPSRATQSIIGTFAAWLYLMRTYGNTSGPPWAGLVPGFIDAAAHQAGVACNSRALNHGCRGPRRTRSHIPVLSVLARRMWIPSAPMCHMPVSKFEIVALLVIGSEVGPRLVKGTCPRKNQFSVHFYFLPAVRSWSQRTSTLFGDGLAGNNERCMSL